MSSLKRIFFFLSQTHIRNLYKTNTGENTRLFLTEELYKEESRLKLWTDSKSYCLNFFSESNLILLSATVADRAILSTALL